MPKKASELSPLAIGRLTKPGMHEVGGVAGLKLQVLPSGGRSWILRVTVGAKRREMGLGGFPDVTVAEAREKARQARAKIQAGIDPIAEAHNARQLLVHAQGNAITFERAATLYIDAHEAGWKNKKHAQQWRNTLSSYAYPVLGDKLVRDIVLADILRVLEPIWRAKTETASRLRSRVELVLDWATTRGYRDGLNPARWKGHLSNLLPAPTKISNGTHYPALDWRVAGDFMVALRDQAGSGAKALEFVILTAARSGEVRGATWGEIDLDDATWTVPKERMKAQRDHTVPLSAAAMGLLKQVPRSTKEPSELVFKAPRGGELSDGTLNAVIDRMAERDPGRWVSKRDRRVVVTHGFRSTFRDWVSESTGYSSEVAEMALAHAIGDKVEAAYRRGDLMDKRRRLMEDWSDYLSRPAGSGDVVPLQGRRA